MTYNPGQAAEIFRHLTTPPAWLILGGPADADEAQTMVRRYPEIEVLAVEPCEAMRQWQLANGFPSPDCLVAAALSDREGTATIRVPGGGAGRRSSMVRACGGVEVEVETVTLDRLSKRYGPFRDAVLWLDIEGMEWPTLVGGEELFHTGAILLVNVEMMPDERPEHTRRIEAFMAHYGFTLAREWNRMPDHQDRIYVREPSSGGAE